MLKFFFPARPGAEPLVDAIRACRTHLIWAAIFSALVNLLYLAPTLYMMQVYDRVVPTGGVSTLILISLAALLALLTLAGLDWLRSRLLMRAGLRLDRLLGHRILGRVIDAPSRQFSSQALREFDNVRAALSGSAALAILDAPWTPLYLACCFLLHPAIGLLTLVGGCVLFVLAWLNERDTRSRFDKSMKAGALAYAAQEAVASQAEVVRALGMRRSSVARQARQRESATEQQTDAQMTSGKYSGAIKFLRLMLQSAALGLAAWLVIKGDISAGSIIASSVLLSRAVAPVELLVGAWPGLIQARASWTFLTDLFVQTAGQERERTALPSPRGVLGLESVSVRLPESGAPQLRNVSLTLGPGQVLGVIGPSGAGKTTLARVIAGAIKPSLGEVRIDGAEYDAREGDDLARYIGYLPQTPSLFPGTVRDNISRFAAAAGSSIADVDRDAVRAAMAAGVHELIQRLPQGYDTVLGSYGGGVSAGQAQRIALARALYGDPVVLVLDEPNSNLDQDGEAALMAAIVHAAGRGAAVVVVSHRAGVLARVDRLLLMREGVVQMQGAREEVLSKIRGNTSLRPVALKSGAAPL